MVIAQLRFAPRRGFTLIELMITMSISLMLMLIAVPFSLAWMDSARQLQTRGDVVDAVGRAKGLAMRNGSMRAWNQGAARVQVNAGALQVVDAATGTVQWSAPLATSVNLTLQDGTTPFNCIAYNSRGVPVIDGPCNQVASRLVVRIANRENLNVDIL